MGKYGELVKQIRGRIKEMRDNAPLSLDAFTMLVACGGIDFDGSTTNKIAALELEQWANKLEDIVKYYAEH
jgi:hypothetical protein